MTENNNKQQTDKQQAEDIWIKARMNPDSGLLETEAQGSPSGLTVLLGAALARIAHEVPNPRGFIFSSMPCIMDAAFGVLEDMEEADDNGEGGEQP